MLAMHDGKTRVPSEILKMRLYCSTVSSLEALNDLSRFVKLFIELLFCCDD